MLFSFLKYLQPTHYFQRFTKAHTSVFPVVDDLPESVVAVLHADDNYQSKLAKAYDLSWQAIQKGYIGPAKTYTNFEQVPLQDNYRFIRKNFHQAWVFYVFAIRIISGQNPIKEFKAFTKTKQVKRLVNEYEHIPYSDWDTFRSTLMTQNPKVSVIIPTLNRYAYLHDVLKDFEDQDYHNFEVIIVDQSEPFQAEFYKNYNLDIQLVRQEEKALWLARNTAIKASKGTLIALSEDDVRIKSDWISSHIKCLDFFKAEVSAGVFYPEGQEIPKDRAFFAIASQFATGNALLYKTVFDRVGLFDRQFEKQRMGDGEFGMRVYLAAIKSVSNPLASCIDVKAGTGGLREMGSWDAFRPSNFFAPRPIPSVVYFFRRYFGTKRTKLALLRMVPISIFPYQYKKHKPLLILAALLTFILLPVVCYQVFKSWRLASKKLKQGALIETL